MLGKGALHEKFLNLQEDQGLQAGYTAGDQDHYYGFEYCLVWIGRGVCLLEFSWDGGMVRLFTTSTDLSSIC